MWEFTIYVLTATFLSYYKRRLALCLMLCNSCVYDVVSIYSVCLDVLWVKNWNWKTTLARPSNHQINTKQRRKTSRWFYFTLLNCKSPDTAIWCTVHQTNAGWLACELKLEGPGGQCEIFDFLWSAVIHGAARTTNMAAAMSEYENSMFLELMDDDGLFVTAKYVIQ